MAANSGESKKGFIPAVYSGWLVGLLSVLMASLIGILVVSPRFSFPVLGLGAGVVALLFWLVQYARIPVFCVERLCCYLAFITGFLGVALFPIDLGPFTLFPFRIFLGLLWGLFAVRVLTQGRLILPISRVKIYMAFLSVWTVYAVMSMAWVASIGDAIRHLIFLLMGVSMIFFAATYFREERDLQRLYWIWFGIFCGLILLGYWEHLSGQHLPVSGYYGETRVLLMFRPTGVFKNPNDYATFLVLSIPFALGTLRYARRRLARPIGLSLSFAAFYLIVVTGSRANLLAVLLEMAFVVLFLTNIRQKIKAALAVAGLAMMLFLPAGPIREFCSEVAGSLSSIAGEAELGTGSVAIRANLARSGLSFLYSTGGFGVGAGNAEYWMANFAPYETAGILNPHNWWLELLINYGILIFTGYIMFYIGLVRALWRIWKQTAWGKRRICETLLLSLVGFSIASISPSSVMAFAPQWLLFAFALTYLNWWRRSQARKVL